MRNATIHSPRIYKNDIPMAEKGKVIVTFHKINESRMRLSYINYMIY